MSVYTCFDMVADCQAAKPEGWLFLARRIVPAMRLLARHYRLSEDAVRHHLSAPNRLAGLAPMPEREFLTLQREPLLAAGGYLGGRAATLDLTALTAALAELTSVERQIAWLEALDYSTGEAAWLLRVSAETAARARDKAAEALGAQLGHRDNEILRANGGLLGDAARSAAPAKATALRQCFELVDGRLSWRDRDALERRLLKSWWEIDQLCRAREADEFLRVSQDLTTEEAIEFLRELGLPTPKPKKRWLGWLGLNSH